MPRRRRIVVVGSAHHITHRGNNRQQVFFDDWCRRKYLDLLEEHMAFGNIQVLGYCLMTNHTHLILVPAQEETLGRCMKRIEGEYASYINFKLVREGHLWQDRFRSFAMDDSHLWAALRYAELNPVRAGMVGDPWDWEWSSARDHLGGQGEISLEMGVWQERWGVEAWSRFLREPTRWEEIAEIRKCTSGSRPFGSEEFVRKVEPERRKSGRPKKAVVVAAAG